MSHYLQLTVGRQHSVFISVCLYFIVIKQEHTESLHSPSLTYTYSGWVAGLGGGQNPLKQKISSLSTKACQLHLVNNS